MDSQRQLKFARLIQKDLSEIFTHEFALLPASGGLATLSTVRVSPDLAVASIYISFLGVAEPDKALEILAEKAGHVRNLLARRIRHQARVVPELRFFKDNTAEEANRIERLIDSLNIPPAEPQGGTGAGA